MSNLSHDVSPSAVQVIFERLRDRAEAFALWEDGNDISARQLLETGTLIANRLRDSGVQPGCIVGFTGEYGLDTVGTFLALFELKAIAVPLSKGSEAEWEMLVAEAEVEFWFDTKSLQVKSLRPEPSSHPLINSLRLSQHPGLIVFTSGSSGKPKAILHDVEKVASKFVVMRPSWRMVLFLLIDHFGGFNTLLACLAHGGQGVCVRSRTPDDVCRAIAGARADLLPTTPSFLSMLISSESWKHHDVSSIKLVTYGAEPMPERVLAQLQTVFPSAEFKQTYGLSELGVLQSASPTKGSLWIRVGGKGFETKIIDGILHIKAASNMLGYLNAKNPIDSDGWMDTGDLVEQDGDLIKFIGRRSDVISVGGQKVYPVEVESVLLEAREVLEATVYPIQHPILGQVVGARISITGDEGNFDAELKNIKNYCKSRLQKYKIPMRFDIIPLDQHASDRGKKIRR